MSSAPPRPADPSGHADEGRHPRLRALAQAFARHDDLVQPVRAQ